MILKKYLRSRGKSKAQSILEYSIIIAVIAAALTLMGSYVRRAIQSNLKMIENQVNTEEVG
ncbi:MAG: hypothetical protein ABH954_01585 [Candidatus Omnitrophota bacterium]